MRGLFKAAAVVLCGLILGLPAESSAQASERSPYLPRGVPAYRPYSWLVGTAFDLRLSDDNTENREDEFVFGLSLGMRFFERLEINTRWMASPDRAEIEQLRLFAGAAIRYVWKVGPIELLPGIGGHIEARLEDHFFLGYVTPFELGVTVFNRLSWSVRVLTGARVLVGDGPIDNILLDPNGLDEDALDDLERIRERRLEGFVGLTFARELR